MWSHQCWVEGNKWNLCTTDTIPFLIQPRAANLCACHQPLFSSGCRSCFECFFVECKQGSPSATVMLDVIFWKTSQGRQIAEIRPSTFVLAAFQAESYLWQQLAGNHSTTLVKIYFLFQLQLELKCAHPEMNSNKSFDLFLLSTFLCEFGFYQSDRSFWDFSDFFYSDVNC